jgi:hypothetical protein
MLKGSHMCKTLLVVVLYDKTYKDSLTLNCLMNKDYDETDLLIINVGPKSLEFDKEFIHTLGFFVSDIYIKEALDGSPLGGVYNSIVKERNDYERFIILDDDCKLSKGYLKKLDMYHTNDIDLQIPHISDRNHGEIHYPVINESVEMSNDGLIVNQYDRVKSIGVGLVIYRSLITKFRSLEMDVFSSNFKLHDVDSDFFERLNLLKNKKISASIQIAGTMGCLSSQKNDTYNKLSSVKRLYNRVLGVRN